GPAPPRAVPPALPREASRAQRDPDVAVELGPRDRSGDVLADDVAPAVDEEGLWEARDAVAADDLPRAVVDERIRDLVTLRERPRVAVEVLRVDPEDDHTLSLPARPGSFQIRRLLLAR